MMKVKEEMILRVVKEFIHDVRFKTLKSTHPTPTDNYVPSNDVYSELWFENIKVSEELSAILTVIERFLDED